MKLKTLKDLHKACWYGETHLAENFKWVKIKDLKEEAIKMVKAIRSGKIFDSENGAENFMDFFNITEEELK